MNHSLSLLALIISVASCREDTAITSEEPLFTTITDTVYQSPLNLAADPSVVRGSDTLFMYFSAADFEIGVVYSLDGSTTWITPGGGNAKM